ncbi:zinc ribbon domain-containing protein [Nitrososphaera viennensis]|uniref:DZANK-type domain-containing protein n=2 Tax=Nitrososphaera viennensis TaxID=1034015 RepID=A0A060HU65_9ARCH|nr:zinc ribbon domain-containing protein [Nitrososphaera viennensis]AIC16956.1 hypothetical protein NVIE_026840 [Nitrososphaera viennensis EN76]UVS68859.1 zinc ribbon domain-containing protein [Nitrososphaera viennensis]CBX88966.1 hypothetical protein with C-terminal Zinc finger, RanBP2-type [Nitrososphaera phage Pro-Nvie1]
MTLPKGYRPERVLWQDDITQGLFRQSVVEHREITTLRVIKNEVGIRLADIDEILVVNTEIEYDSVYHDRRKNRALGPEGRFNAKTRVIGDIQFFQNGNLVLVLNDVYDPEEVAGIVRSARAGAAEEQALRRVKEVLAGQAPVSGSRTPVSCPSCAGENPPGSNFCNKCGAALPPGCPKCGSSNLTGSSFCSMCGSPLS